MCTIAIVRDRLLDAPLALAANRDEFYARPAQAPVRFADGAVGGRDDVLGGSWFAVTPDGRFAAVTNQREAATGRAPRSRGDWVLAALAAGDRAAMRAYVESIDPRDYASGNLVFGDATGVDVAYLRRNGDRTIVALPPGLTILGNDRIDAPGQPKQAMLGAALAEARTWAEFVDAAAAGLAAHTIPATLPPMPPGLPVPAAAWPALQAVCVHTPSYGTRSSTLAALGPGQVRALQWTAGPPCQHPFVDATELVAQATLPR